MSAALSLQRAGVVPDAAGESPSAAASAAGDEPSREDLRETAMSALATRAAIRRAIADAERRDAGDPFGAWVREVGRQGKIPTAEEAQALARDGQIAELARRNLPLVVGVVVRTVVAMPWQNRIDLVGAGNIGLMEAARRYDWGRGVAFSTYATYWVRKYVWDEARLQRTLCDDPAVTYLSQVVELRHSGMEALTLADVLRAPDLLLDVPPVRDVHQLSRAVAALHRDGLLDDAQATLLVLRAGALDPRPVAHPRRAPCPEAWIAGATHSQRLVAEALGVGLATAQRRLARLEAHLARLRDAGGRREAAAILLAMAAPARLVNLRADT